MEVYHRSHRQITETILNHANNVECFRPCHFVNLKNNLRTATCYYLWKQGKLKRVGRGKYAKA